MIILHLALWVQGDRTRPAGGGTRNLLWIWGFLCLPSWQDHRRLSEAAQHTACPGLLPPPSLRTLVANGYSPRCWRESREHWSLGGADAPRGGQGLLGRARRQAGGNVRGCQGRAGASGLGKGRVSLGLGAPGCGATGNHQVAPLTPGPDPLQGAGPPPRAPLSPASHCPCVGAAPRTFCSRSMQQGCGRPDHSRDPAREGRRRRRQALSGSWALRAWGRESREGAPPGCGALIPR